MANRQIRIKVNRIRVVELEDTIIPADIDIPVTHIYKISETYKLLTSAPLDLSEHPDLSLQINEILKPQYKHYIYDVETPHIDLSPSKTFYDIDKTAEIAQLLHFEIPEIDFIPEENMPDSTLTTLANVI